MPKQNRMIDGLGNPVDLYTGSNLFLSTEQTGNAGAQSIAHTLDRVPAAVFAVITEIPAGAAGADVAYGTHTSTACVVTVTNLVKYVILALC
jgi:hypothetical protein